MLFRGAQIAAIARGEITMTVRAWRRPQAAVGGRYRLRGERGIEVTAVERVPLARVTADDARRCGFRSREALLAHLAPALVRTGAAAADAEPEVYRITFRFLPELRDERAELARDDALDNADFDAIRRRLTAADTRGGGDPWTLPTLRAIAERPSTRAAELAAGFNMETQPFKARVRRLKALGLTLSLETGYELSPRGRAFLARLNERH